jgi:S-DNA-T family DNA segregation ATPase FtsK/SpoIIIE
MPTPTDALDLDRPRRSSVGRPLDLAEEREPVALELAGVFLALIGLLLALSIVTLAPEGSRRALANVAGAVGRSVAHALTLALGLGAYVLAAFPVAWGIACLHGRLPRSFGRKVLLAPAVAAFLAILAALLFRKLAIPGLWQSGPGGYVGKAFAAALFTLVGKGAGLLAFALLSASLLLTTDLRIGALLGKRSVRRGARKARPAADDGAEDGGVAVAEADDVEGVGAPRFEGVEDDDAYEDTEHGPSDASSPDGERLLGRDEDDLDLADASDIDLDRALRDATADEPPAAPVAETRVRRVAPPRRRGAYEFPPADLLERGESVEPDKVRSEIERNAAVLATTLRSFGIETRVVSQRRGPVITFYELALEAGTRINRVATLDRDLAVALKSESVRIVAPIPGKDTIGVEVPNTIRDAVRLRDLIDEGGDRVGRRAIPLFLGKDALGEPIIEDMAGMPHMLIAGATGSGKSVCVNSILLSILMTRTPEEVKVVLIDPKQVELAFFEGIPHLLTPVVTNMKKAAQILEWAVAKMEQRYELFLKSGVRNIAGYNGLGDERRAKIRADHGYDELDAPNLMPYVVIVVDELADLMLQHGKDVETAIIRLAAKSRAVGIHLILATQRPSVDVVTGLIKSNMPMRMSFKVSSMIDSRVVLDHKGAEKLLGKGDTLFIPPGSSVLKRAQGTFISDAEVRTIVEFVKEKAGPAEYTDILNETGNDLPDPNEEDELYDEAVRVVLTTKLGSASMLQRRFGIGYTRASRLIDMMCDHKVVGPHKGSKARELLLTIEEWEAAQAKRAQDKGKLPLGYAAGAATDPGAGADVEADAPMGTSDADDGIADKGGTSASAVSSPWD